MTGPEAAELLRALVDPDPTVQRTAAVRARQVPPAWTERILGALAPLLAAEDKYLRRAAAASYVALHPMGPTAPALRPLHADPAQLVALTARGGVLDRAHELAELAFVVRTLASASIGTPFATTVTRWHRYLWLYSPNPRAEAAMSAVALDDLDRDAQALRDSIVAVRLPPEVTMLQLDLDAALVVRGFRHGTQTWSATTAATLPALRRLADLVWTADDAPWPEMFAGGAFALAVAGVLATSPLDGVERELSTRIGGEQIFLGFLRTTGLAFTE